jgi:ubiquinone/menaquinone biosynthesis C-methylase UbiE
MSLPLKPFPMPDPTREIERIKHVYTNVYRPEAQDIGYTWHPRNMVSIIFRQAQERTIIALWNHFNLPLENAPILDVGCGTGNFLRFLLSLGAHPRNLHGVDLMPHRISQAINQLPCPVDLLVGNAAELPYQTAYFELVSQFTMFSAVEDPGVRHSIAQEIIRVLKPGGYLLSYDMKNGDGTTTWGVGRGEISTLFPHLKRLSSQNLHVVWLSRLARRSWIAASLWDSLPWLPRTHDLILLQKPLTEGAA